MGAELFGLYLACLLAVAMELLVIWYAFFDKVDWWWTATSALVAIPLTYFVLPSALAADVASGARDDLNLAVSLTQVLAQIAIVVAGVVAYKAWRSQKSAWEVTTLWSFLQEWEGVSMRRDRSRTAEVLLEEERTGAKIDLNEYLRVLNFFEVIGLLVHRGAFTADDAWEWFSDIAKGYWMGCKWRIDEARREDLNNHKEFKYLIEQFERIDQIRGSKPFKEEALRDQLEYEASLAPGPVSVRLEPL